MTTFLADFDPSKLEALKQQFPEQADLFRPGMKLGIDNASRDEQAARVMLTKACFDNITLACSKFIPALKKKIDSQKGLWGALFGGARTIIVSGERMTLRDVYECLVNLQNESDKVSRELTLFSTFQDYGDVRQYIRRANEISSDMNRFMLMSNLKSMGTRG